MRRLMLIAVLLVPLAAAPPAFAKEVQSVTACGTDDCTTTRAPGFMRAMTDVGPPTGAPAGPGEFYRLVITVADGAEVVGRDRLSWVPSTGRLLTVDGMWIAVRPAVRRGLDRLTRGLAARPAARLPGFQTAAAEAVAPAPSPPASSPPVSSQSDVPIVPVLAGAMALVLAALLVRRHRRGGGPLRALRSAD